MTDQFLPPLDQLADEEDELDGCDIDFSSDAIRDDQVLETVLLGDSRPGTEEAKKKLEFYQTIEGIGPLGATDGLPVWLRAAGLKVVEVDGWQTRGNRAFNPGGVVCHHTADGAGEIPSLRVLIHGRSDLPGPLCQVGLGRSGTVYVIAKYRANHAGSGGWKGMVGNSSVWGIEAENRGGGGDPWPKTQLDAYYTLTAALQEHTVHGPKAEYVCGHKEWAPNRKVDPHTINMSMFRSVVQSVLDGGGDDWLEKLTPEEQHELLDKVRELHAAEFESTPKEVGDKTPRGNIFSRTDLWIRLFEFHKLPWK